jgi:RecA-family ATPase
MKKKVVIKTRMPPGQWDGDDPPPEPKWLVDRCIMQTGIGLLLGQWGTGKTYVAIDLSLSVITGQHFAGRRVPEQCGVLYLALEGAHTILRRLKVARECRELMENTPFFVTRECPTLSEKNAAETLLDYADATDKEMQSRHGVRLGLIIIDTLIVAAGWVDENRNAEVQAVMRVLRALSDETDTFVLAIDHHGKDPSRGARGGSDKEGSIDVVLSLTPGRMTQTKLREGSQGEVTPFELKVHKFPSLTTPGETWTECTVEWGVTGHKTNFKSISTLRKAMQAVSTAEIKVAGRTVHATSKADVRNAFAKSMKGKSSSAVRNAWKRAYDTAIENEVVECMYDDETFLYVQQER